MLIVCPSCATAFRVTAEALGPAGRQVRCAQCRTVWHAAADSAVPETVVAEAAAAEPVGHAAKEEADWGAAFAEEAERDVAFAPDAIPTTESPPIAPEAAAEALPPPATPPRPRSRDIESQALRRRPRSSQPERGRFQMSLPATIVVVGSAVLALFLTGREQVVRSVPDAATVYESIGLPVNLRGVEFQDVRGANEMVDGVVVLVVEGRLVNITPRTVDLPRLRLAVRDAGGKEIYTWTSTAPKPQLGPGEAAAFRSRLASPPPDGKTVEVRFFTRQDAGG